MERARYAILLVDDTVDNLRVLGEMLEGEGHDLKVATSGAQALEIVRSSMVDLILLDIRMPGMDGYEVCAELKRDAHSREIPVIFLTALDSVDDEVRGLRLGAVDYVAKPFNLELVKSRVANQLALLEARRELNHQNLRLEEIVAERTAELEQRTVEVRLLLARVEREREEERSRVARELHDDLGQSVTALGMALYLLERRMGKLEGPVAEMAEDMRSILAEVSENMRRIVTDLRPSVLDRIGLRPALALLVKESGGRSGMVVDFSCSAPDELALRDETLTALYRVAKEALTNALRYSGSPRIQISLAAAGGRIMLEVRDEGRGFEPLAGQGGAIRSFGILGMRERCRALGGEFSLSSGPGAGTSVRASFPMLEGEGDAHTDR